MQTIFSTKVLTHCFIFSICGEIIKACEKNSQVLSGEELPPVVSKANHQEDDQKDHASHSTSQTFLQPPFDGRCVQEACLLRGVAEGVGQEFNKKGGSMVKGLYNWFQGS